MRRALGVASAVLTTACTTPPLAPDVPHAVDRLPLTPYAEHEACFDGIPGDRLDYRWQTSEPVDFDIRYREGGAVVAPIVRERSRGASGIFEVRLRERYCLHWQAGNAGAFVDYRLVLRRAPP